MSFTTRTPAASRLLRPLVLMALPLALFAQVPVATPQAVNYQGRLTDNTPQQNPVNGTVNMAFAIYDAPTAGTLLWSEPASGGVAVSVVNGVFSRLLGASVPLPASVFTGAATGRYLQITLNPGATQEILSPRQQLAAAPFAARLDGLGNPAAASWSGTGGTGVSCSLASLQLFAENFVPSNFYPCDGRLIPISQNTALFSLIGINYGGNGTTTFAVPDLRKVTPDGMMYGICQSGVFPSR